jgi:hypothetical protein
MADVDPLMPGYMEMQRALSDLALSEAIAGGQRPRRLDVVLATPEVRAAAEAMFPELTMPRIFMPPQPPTRAA